MNELHTSCQLTVSGEVQLGTYRHYKGNYYEVIGFAHHSETLEDLVVYRALKSPDQWWVRPITMFLEEIETEQGVLIPRFSYCDGR